LKNRTQLIFNLKRKFRDLREHLQW
jgi:hypothetical protein